MALDYLTTAVPPKDRAYTRFLSLYDVDDLDELRTLWKFGNWWNQQMSFDEYFHLVRPVPGSGARLFALDLRHFRWNGAAWQAVARREPRFRQPWIHFKKAEILRREAGYVGVGPNGEGTTPVLVVVSWMWFLRETLETQRSTSSYPTTRYSMSYTPSPVLSTELATAASTRARSSGCMRARQTS